LAAEAIVLLEESMDVFCVVDTSVEFCLLTRIVYTDAKSFLSPSTTRILEVGVLQRGQLILL